MIRVSTPRTEIIEINFLQDAIVNEYGIQVNPDADVIKSSCYINEKIVNTLNPMSGSYVAKEVVEFYIPYIVASKYNLSGATIKRKNKRTYIVNAEPIIRGYASHVLVIATEDNNNVG